MVRNADWDYNARKGSWVLEHTRPDDVVLSADTPVFTRQLRYEGAARVVNLWTTPAEDVTRMLEAPHPECGHILALGDIFKPPDPLRRRYPDQYREIVSAMSPYRESFNRVHEDVFGGVYLFKCDKAP